MYNLQQHRVCDHSLTSVSIPGIPGERAASPDSPKGPQPIFSDWPLPNSKTRMFMESNPVVSMAGKIGPAFSALRSRWNQIRGLEYRGRLSPEMVKGGVFVPVQTHKHDCQSGPRELLAPPTNLSMSKSKKTARSEDSEESDRPSIQHWIPIGYHRGGSVAKNAPFSSPSHYPLADWSLRETDRWLLKAKERVIDEKIPAPLWVPAGTHRLTSQLSWSDESKSFQRKVMRQWSTLDPSDEAISLTYHSHPQAKSLHAHPSELALRPATAHGTGRGATAFLGARGREGDLDSSMLSLNLSRDSHNKRPSTAIAHERSWQPGGAPLHGDFGDAPNTKYAFRARW